MDNSCFFFFFQASSCARFCMCTTLHYFSWSRVCFGNITCTQPTIKKYNCPSLMTRCSSPWEFLNFNRWIIYNLYCLNLEYISVCNRIQHCLTILDSNVLICKHVSMIFIAHSAMHQNILSKLLGINTSNLGKNSKVCRQGSVIFFCQTWNKYSNNLIKLKRRVATLVLKEKLFNFSFQGPPKIQ